MSSAEKRYYTDNELKVLARQLTFFYFIGLPLIDHTNERMGVLYVDYCPDVKKGMMDGIQSALPNRPLCEFFLKTDIMVEWPQGEPIECSEKPLGDKGEYLLRGKFESAALERRHLDGPTLFEISKDIADRLYTLLRHGKFKKIGLRK